MINEAYGVERIVWPEPLAIAEGSRPATLYLSAEPEPGRPGSFGPSVVLDFGCEMFGGLRVEVVAVLHDESCRVRVRLGESVSEAMVGTYVDAKERVRAGSTFETAVTGFRFARVEIVDLASRIEIKLPLAYVAPTSRGLSMIGFFHSDDPQLNAIWQVGARTAALCMQDLIWDGIKRGRTVWAGDLHPASAAIAAVFGAHPIIPASLDYLRDRTTGDSGIPDWMNGIPAYSLWWILCQADWYLLTGDRAYLADQAAYLKGLIAKIDEGVDAEGVEQFEGWRYLDWATTRDPRAIAAGYQGLTAWSLRASRTLADALDDPALADHAARILARVESQPPPASTSKQATALLVLGGLADAAEANRESLAVDPLAGLTPFLGYHVLEARALAGDHVGALALVRDYWGAMVALGATTYWEDFDIDWAAGSGRIDEPVDAPLRDIHAGLGRNVERGMALSLCHAWSAGPTPWLTRHVLGVQPLRPGCRSIRITPHLGDLNHLTGRVPTPLGEIWIEHTRRPDGSVLTEYRAPEGIEVFVGE